jgi:hypothetical protein
MTSRIATSPATLLSATLASFYAAAGVCAFLGRDPLTLRDTELFYKSPQSNTWVSLDATPRDGTLASQTVTFAYVIQERLDQARPVPQKIVVKAQRGGRSRPWRR